MLGSATRTAGRLGPWARTIAIGEIALTAKRHLDRLDEGEPSELRRLITKSKGRRKNLSAGERQRLMALVRKLEPAAFAKTATRQAMPLRRKR